MTKCSNEKGYTMLEVIMYTGLIIILTASIASMVSNVFYRYKIGRINQQVIDIKKTITYYTATWENYGDYDDGSGAIEDSNHFLSFGRMQQDNVLPMDLKNGLHALGGSIDVGCAINYKDEYGNAVANDDATNNTYMFYIQFDGLTPEACIEVVTQGPFYRDSSDLDTLIVNNDYLWKYKYSHFNYTGYDFNETTLEYTGQVVPGTTNQKAVPTISLSIVDAVKACNREKDNIITWIFS